ncbi:hypothetical protein C8R43DRAFT_608341 [Mycena crocata]|nr:hypothetical protein C8R43DRAFT_608341 [Mycena crocata]
MFCFVECREKWCPANRESTERLYWAEAKAEGGMLWRRVIVLTNRDGVCAVSDDCSYGFSHGRGSCALVRGDGVVPSAWLSAHRVDSPLGVIDVVHFPQGELRHEVLSVCRRNSVVAVARVKVWMVTWHLYGRCVFAFVHRVCVRVKGLGGVHAQCGRCGVSASSCRSRRPAVSLSGRSSSPGASSTPPRGHGDPHSCGGGS